MPGGTDPTPTVDFDGTVKSFGTSTVDPVYNVIGANYIINVAAGALLKNNTLSPIFSGESSAGLVSYHIAGTLEGTARVISSALAASRWDIDLTGTLRNTSGNSLLGGGQFGADKLTLQSGGSLISSGGSLYFFGGDDQFIVNGGTITNLAFVAFGSGDDLFELNATPSGSTQLRAGGGTDTVRLNNSGSFSLAALESGWENLELNGTAWTLSGTTADTFTGGTGLNSGTLTLDITSGTTTLAGVVSGPGALAKDGTGALTLSAANTYTGGTTISTGTLNVTNSSGLGTGAVSNRATLNFSNGVTINNTINNNSGSTISFNDSSSAGSATITNNGSSSTLFNDSSSAGNATISTGSTDSTFFNDSSSAGGATINNAGFTAFNDVSSAGTATINNFGFTVFNDSSSADTATIANTTIGGGGLDISGHNGGIAIGEVSGAGSVFLGANDLSLGGLNTDATISGVIADDGLSGGTGGSLTKIGTGTLTLGGNNSYSGGTQLNAGTLLVNSTTGSGTGTGAVNVASAATLGGGGTITGPVTIANGGRLSPGTPTGPGTLTTGALTLNANSQLDYQMGTPGVVGGGVNDLTSATGNLVLDGALNITDLGNFGDGTYRLINYSGALTDNGLLFGTTSAPFDFTVQTGTANQVNLLVAAASAQFWDGANTTANGVIDGGTGSWNATTTNWTNSGGNANTIWAGGLGAVFAGTAGTVTIADGFTADPSSLDFQTPGYTLAATGSGNLAITGDTLFTTAAGTPTTISAPITGSGALNKRGNTLTLAGANTYTGGTTISTGTLNVINSSGLGTGAVSNRATLNFSNGVTINNTINNNSGSTISFNDSSSAGSATITNNGSSSTLFNDSSSAGTATINNFGGTVFNDNSTADTAAITSTSGLATLDISGHTGGIAIGEVSGAGSVFLGANDLSLGGLNTDDTISGVIQDGSFSGGGTGGSLTKTGTGTLTVTGANTYTGGTTISGGILNASADNNLGDASGGITLDGGTLQYGAGFDSARVISVTANNGTVDTNGNASTLSGVISDAGSPGGALTKTGAGTLTLTGTNTYTGGTAINTGTLAVNGSLGIGAVNVANGATLTGTGSIGGAVTVADGATLSGQSGQTLGLGSLALSSGSNVNVALGAPSNKALFDVNGDVTLDGLLNVSDAGGFGAGIYRIADYGGNLTDNGLDIGSTPSGTSPSDLSVQTATPGQINLVDTAGQTLNFWDGATNHDNNQVDGGTGIWQLGDRNWTGANGAFNGAYTNDALAVFEGTPGTVTVNDGPGNIQVSGIQFAVDGYTIDGDSITLTDADTALRVGDGTQAGASTSATIAAILRGTGGLDKTDLGTLILTGTNTYNGGTTITAGTLQGNTDSLQGNISDNAALIFNQNTDGTYADVVDGSGDLTKTGGGTLTLTGSNTYTGGTTISDGTLQGDTDSLPGNITDNAALIFNQTTAGTYADSIDGSGTLTKTGGGTLALTGINTYTGGTTISAGILQLGDGGTNGSIKGDVTDNGILAFNRSDAVTIDGVISGTGSVRQNGSGTTTLTGTNTYSGGTTISDGTLQGNTDSLQGDITDNAALIFNQNTDGTYTDIIDGNGTLTKTGSGLLSLTGDNTYAGATAVNAGTLAVNGATAGAATVASGATLNGTGSIGGAVTVADGGMLAGQSGQTLNMASLALSGSSNVNVALGAPSQTALFDVANDLTLDGTLNVSDAGGFGAGVYRIADYGGTLTDNRLAIGTKPAGTPKNELSVQTATANQINLVNTTGQTLNFWDGGNTANHDNGSIDGGPGTWQVGDRNWTGMDGTVNGPYQPNPTFAVFEGNAGTVTVDDGNGDIQVTGIQFATDGYGVTHDPIGLANADTAIRVGDGTQAGANMTATITSALTGPGGLNKTDLGTLILTGDNAYMGGTTIGGGTLAVSSDSNLGAGSGGLIFSGGTLDITADGFTSSRGVTLDTAGTVQVDTGTSTFSGAIADGSGAGSLTKTGDGKLILAGADTYTGGTTISAGILQLGDGGTSGSITGDVTDNAALIFNRADAVTIDGAISGTGSVRQSGPGTTTLTGANTYTGGTTISDGALQGNTDSLQGDITDNAALIFKQTTAGTYAGKLVGNGDLRFNGGGAVQLTGDSSGYTGASTVTDSALVVNRTLGGSLDVGQGGRLQGTGTVGDTTIGDGGTIAPGNSIGTLHVDGALTLDKGSRYEVEVQPGGTESDLIAATGSADIGGGAVAHIGADGSYDPTSTYTILTADNGVNGTFDSVSSDFAFLDAILGYDANDVTLTLQRNDTDFVDAAATPNQRAVAGGADSLTFGNALFDSVVQLSDPAARRAFDLLSGEIHASTKTALIQDSRYLRQAIIQRMRNASTPSAPASDTQHTQAVTGDPDSATWTRAIGAFGGTDSDGNAADLDRSTRGFLLGGDTQVAKNWRVGATAGFTRSEFDVDTRQSSGDSDNYHLGVYTGTQNTLVRFTLGAGYSWHDIDTQRSVAFTGFSDALQSAHHAATAQVFSELGYAIDLGAATVEPFANAAYVNLDSDGFTEHGGAAALHVDGDDTDTTFSTLGLRASHTLDLDGTTIALHGSAGWRHAYGDTTPTVTNTYAGGSEFTVAGLPIEDDSAIVDGGVGMDIGDNATLGVSYGGLFGSDAHDNAGKIDLTVRF